MRFGVFSYYNANDIDNAVMRSKLKYVAPLKWSSSGGLGRQHQCRMERHGWHVAGQPRSDEASASYPSAVSKSGVINYINQFGTASQNYKTYDNVGKLYYEGLRYLRGLQPTTAFYTRATATSADGFPIIRSWDDPVQYWCQKNYHHRHGRHPYSLRQAASRRHQHQLWFEPVCSPNSQASRPRKSEW